MYTPCSRRLNKTSSLVTLWCRIFLLRAQEHTVSLLQVLCTLGWSLSQLKGLKHLGLHSLVLTSETLSALGQLLNSLPPCVSVLTIAIDVAGGASTLRSLPERLLFFKAVGLVRGLRQLALPQWEALVGVDAAACVAPLLDLPLLEAVFVNAVQVSPAFPECLRFLEIREGAKYGF